MGTRREKGNAGVPDIPNSGRLVSVEYASITDRKLRGQLRNAGDIEKQVQPKAVAHTLAHSLQLGRASRLNAMACCQWNPGSPHISPALV